MKQMLMNKKIIVLPFLEAVFLYVIFLALKTKEGAVPSIVHVSVSIIVLAMLTLPDYERILAMQKKKYILSGILSTLFCLMFSIRELTLGVQDISGHILFIFAFVASAFYLITYVYCRLSEISENNYSYHTAAEINKTLVICIAAVVIMSFLMVLSTDIGVYAEGDVGEVFDMARGIDSLSEWHTLGYVFLHKILISFLGESLRSVIKFNCFLYMLVNIFTLIYLGKILKNKRVVIVYTLASILVFSPYYYNLVGYKDNVFSAGFLGVIIYIVYLITSEENKVYIAVLGCAAMVLMSATRHGGIVPVLVGAVGMAVYSLRQRNVRKMLMYFVPALATIIINFGISFTGANFFHAEKNPEYIAFTTPMYMVSAMANEGVNFQDEDRVVLEQVASLGEWASFYNKYWLDDAARDYGKIGSERIEKISYLMEVDSFKGKLIKINWHLVTHNPVKYVRCLLDASSIVWEIGRPVDGYEWALPYEKTDDIKYKAAFVPVSGFCAFTRNVPIWNSVSWRGGFALFGLLVLVMLVIDIKRYDLLVVLAPILIWEIMFLISCYAQDSRYILPAIEIATLLLVVIPNECRRN